MCKHEFKLEEKSTVVITYCKKCGAIGDVHQLYLSQPYPLYPHYYDPYWYWNSPLSGTTSVGSDLTGSTAGTLTGCDYANTSSSTSETVWMVDLGTGEISRCK